MKPRLDDSNLIARRLPIGKRWTVCLLLAAILATMIAIFLLSSESVAESGERSFGVTVQIARILHRNFDSLSNTEQIEIVDGMHRLVRKGAHFTEYALLGGLLILVLNEMFLSRTYSARYQLYLALIAAAFGLSYAIFDEVHQKFVNRGASPRDVCIDFAGVIFGIGLVIGITHIIRLIRNEKTADKGASKT